MLVCPCFFESKGLELDLCSGVSMNWGPILGSIYEGSYDSWVHIRCR